MKFLLKLHSQDLNPMPQNCKKLSYMPNSRFLKDLKMVLKSAVSHNVNLTQSKAPHSQLWY